MCVDEMAAVYGYNVLFFFVNGTSARVLPMDEMQPAIMHIVDS